MNRWEFIKYKLSNTLLAFVIYLIFLFAMSIYAPDNKITEFCLNTSATIAVGYLLYRQGEKNAMSEFNGNGNGTESITGSKSNEKPDGVER